MSSALHRGDATNANGHHDNLIDIPNGGIYPASGYHVIVTPFLQAPQFAHTRRQDPQDAYWLGDFASRYYC
jgi:hypothetical protein